MARFSAVSARLDIQLLTSQQRSREVCNDSPTSCLAQEGGVLQNLCVMLVLVRAKKHFMLHLLLTVCRHSIRKTWHLLNKYKLNWRTFKT